MRQPKAVGTALGVWMNNAVRVGAMVASGILFAAFLYLVLSGAREGQYITVAVVFVFAVLATRLDDITNLKFGATGVAAGLEKKLREAQATVEQLQSVAELFAQLSLHQIASSNRLGGLTPQQKRVSVEKIKTALKQINFTDARVNKAMEIYHPYEDFDYYHWTMYGIFHSMDEKVIAVRNEFKEQHPDKGIGSNPSPEEVEAFLKSKGWNKGEVAERLKDWKHYRRKHTHRRIEQYEARHEEKARPLAELLA